MWSTMIWRTSSAVQSPSSTHGASWLCQTRVWQRRSWPFSSAMLVTTSPSVKLNTPCSGSVKSHWITRQDNRHSAGNTPREEVSCYLVAIGGSRLAELVGIVTDGVVLLIGILLTRALTLARSISGGTEVHKASALGELVQLGIGRSRQQGQSEGGEMHGGASV